VSDKMPESHAKGRLESLSRHLTTNSASQQQIRRPKFELVDHTVDYVRSLRVKAYMRMLKEAALAKNV
jgi:hypothetical protein